MDCTKRSLLRRVFVVAGLLALLAVPATAGDVPGAGDSTPGLSDAESYLSYNRVLSGVYLGDGWSASLIADYRAEVAENPEATLPKLRLICCLLDNDQEDVAKEECLQFIGADPDNPHLWHALARVYEKEDRPREAFATYTQVLSLDPQNSQAHARQGKLFCEFGQFDAAEASCRRALVLNEDDALAHAYLGVALSQMGQEAEARTHAAIAQSAGLNMAVVWRKLGE